MRSLSQMWYERWGCALGGARYFEGETEHYCRHMLIAQMNMVCYEAQEWAGARK